MTDAHLVLGRLDPDGFAAGTIALNERAARLAVDTHVGAALSLDAERSAIGIIEIINENMATAAREHAIEVGRGIAGRTLIAIGGAASLHAADLATKLQIDKILVPVAAGVGSAAGFLRAPLAFEKSRSQHQILSRYTPDSALRVIEELLKEAIDILQPVAGSRAIGTTLSAQMRYRGQGYEITVPLQSLALQTQGENYLRSAFERSYRHLYGRVLPNKDIEILGWTARGAVPLLDAVSGSGWPSKSVRDQRKWTLVEQAGGKVSALAFNRGSLEVDQKVAGPALVVDTGTTVMIPSGFCARVLVGGHLLLTRVSVEAVESAA